jgi:hypothetical protein
MRSLGFLSTAHILVGLGLAGSPCLGLVGISGFGPVGISGLAHAQDAFETPAMPQADPADVSSVDAIVAAVYDVISGPAGEGRDWDRWRSLFLPEARLIDVRRTTVEANDYRVFTPEDYVRRNGSYLEQNGFFEEEIGRTQEAFGPVVHLFSAYQSKRAMDDDEPFARGINSFQLFHDGNRWWVLTIYWTGEGPDLPIPPKYLSGGDIGDGNGGTAPGTLP